MLRVTLPPDLEDFAAASVASGRYASVDALVSRAVQLLRTSEAAREAGAVSGTDIRDPSVHRPGEPAPLSKRPLPSRTAVGASSSGAPGHDRERARAVAAALREASRGITLGPGLTARGLLEAGRRGEA